ncbi:MAG: ABC transporter ATP-binding protein [Phycisphaerales bacterium]|jgi:NitT/TauT family transport system ATP-binding protein|nr:ABC transporter ATP-binding protein [Phycisphaerales bacterium]
MTEPVQIGGGAPAVSLRGITRRFEGGVLTLENLNLSVQAGEFLAILGPSGCGKSTLLRLVAGLDHPNSGEVHVGSREMPSRGGIAYVFQDPHLMPWRNVIDNVALPLELRGESKSRRRESAKAAIEKVGLADASRRYPNQLSGGMKMRVSLARALVTEPELLLMDEPFGSLDELTRQMLDEQLYALWQERRMTVLFVTHTVHEAVFLSSRAIVMSRRPGRIVLNHQSDLPEMRGAWIRTEPVFMQECRVLYKALEWGSA